MTESTSYERKPIAIVYEEKSAYKDTYAGAEDLVFLEAHHLIPEKPATDSVVLFMHPAGAGGAWSGPDRAASRVSAGSIPTT